MPVGEGRGLAREVRSTGDGYPVPFDRGEGRRRWRPSDLGLYRTFLEADAPRVTCREHGVVASVPWVRHDARHTVVFEQTVGRLATRTAKSTLEQLLRVARRTVGAIVARVVVADGVAARDPLAGLPG